MCHSEYIAKVLSYSCSLELWLTYPNPYHSVTQSLYSKFTGNSISDGAKPQSRLHNLVLCMPVRETNSVLFTDLCDDVWWVHADPPAFGLAHWHLSKTLNKGKKLFWSLTYIHRDEKSSSAQVLACKLWACELMGSGCSLQEAIRALGKSQQVPGDPGAEWCSQTPVVELQNRRSLQPMCVKVPPFSPQYGGNRMSGWLPPSTFKIN